MDIRKAGKENNYRPNSLYRQAHGAGRFFLTNDCEESLEIAFSEAVWDTEVKDKDERLDDGSTDIDSLDAFEYTIERDMKYLIQEVEDV